MNTKSVSTLIFILITFLACGQTIKPKQSILFDKSRNREIPIAVYSNGKDQKQPVAIISHGYGGGNTAYGFIANQLVSLGYYVVSIQHDLKGDIPMPTSGDIMVVRKPYWQRGVDNIQFVIAELKRLRRTWTLINYF